MSAPRLRAREEKARVPGNSPEHQHMPPSRAASKNKLISYSTRTTAWLPQSLGLHNSEASDCPRRETSRVVECDIDAVAPILVKTGGAFCIQRYEKTKRMSSMKGGGNLQGNNRNPPHPYGHMDKPTPAQLHTCMPSLHSISWVPHFLLGRWLCQASSK